MKHLERARPPGLDEVDHTVDWTKIASRPRYGRSRARRLSMWAIAGAVPVLAGAAAFALIGPPATVTPPLPPVGQGAPDTRTAEQLLRTAANGALTAKPSGRYFVWQVETGYTFAANGYDVLVRRYLEEWQPASTEDKLVYLGQHLGAAPFGPGGEAAWRADGSPATWRLPATAKAEASTVTAAPGQRQTLLPTAREVGPTRLSFTLAGQSMSAETMAGLPATGAGLRAWLTERYEAGARVDERLIEDALQILTRMPVTPAVRGAAFEMLAGVGTVELIGPAGDQHGRAGVAVAFPVDHEDDVNRLRVVFNEANGAILSVEHLRSDGKLAGYDLMLSHGWTDESPA